MTTMIDTHRAPHLHTQGDSDDTTIRPILAERYKTKMCRNFIQQGMCPYESRCMFAHGEGELRTKEMNLQDGLVTEEAIRNFRRVPTPNAQETEVTYSPTAPPCYCPECLAATQTSPSTQAYPSYANYGDYYYNLPPCDCEECQMKQAAAQACTCIECRPAPVKVTVTPRRQMGSPSVTAMP